MGTRIGDAPRICKAGRLSPSWCVCIISKRYYWKEAIDRVYLVADVDVGGQNCVAHRYSRELCEGGKETHTRRDLNRHVSRGKICVSVGKKSKGKKLEVDIGRCTVLGNVTPCQTRGYDCTWSRSRAITEDLTEQQSPLTAISCVGVEMLAARNQSWRRRWRAACTIHVLFLPTANSLTGQQP
jgi:hypothetical protein